MFIVQPVSASALPQDDWRSAPCREWTGRRDKDGYGITRIPGEGRVSVHRKTYIDYYGGPPLTRVDVIAHRCDNPPCYEPLHLFKTTRAGNHRDMVEKGRARGRFSGMTECIHGHTFTPENVRLDTRSQRHCRTCDRRRDCDRFWLERIRRDAV